VFFGQDPFLVVSIDTGFKFKEIYDFRDTERRYGGLYMR